MTWKTSTHYGDLYHFLYTGAQRPLGWVVKLKTARSYPKSGIELAALCWHAFDQAGRVGEYEDLESAKKALTQKLAM